MNIHPPPEAAVAGGECTRRCEGFSLIEIMIGSILVVTFLGSVMSLVAQQGVHRRTNLQTTLATNAALSRLEEVRGMDISDVPKLDGTDFDVLGVGGETGGLQPIAGDPDGLPGEFTVTIDQTSAGVTLYRVTATVTWRDGNRERSLWLESLVGERK